MSKAQDHVKRGLKVHGSEKAARKIVELVKTKLGKNYPNFFDTDLGKAIEAPLVCTLVHEAASRFDLPGGDKIGLLAGYALEGCSGDLAIIVSKYLGPMVGDLGGLALVFADGFETVVEADNNDDDDDDDE